MQITRGVSSASIVAALATNTFDTLPFGGNTSSFPALRRAGTTIQVRLADNSNDANLSAGSLIVQPSGQFQWTTRSALDSPSDGTIGIRNNAGTAIATLAVEATHQLAQRSGTNAQTFRLYNTYTDASNYERGAIKWVSNIWTIDSQEVAGTGTQRSLEVRAGGTVVALEGIYTPGNGTNSSVSVRRDGTSGASQFGVFGNGLTSTALLHTRLAPSINQASGTYCVLDINPTETAIGAGPHYLIRGRIGAGGDVFNVDRGGSLFAAGHLTAGAANNVGWNGRTSLSSPADGQLQMSNNANTSRVRWQVIGDGLVAFMDPALNGAAMRFSSMTAPSSPAGTSWYVYTDTADGKLKAKNGSGTVRELAIP